MLTQKYNYCFILKYYYYNIVNVCTIYKVFHLFKAKLALGLMMILIDTTMD